MIKRSRLIFSSIQTIFITATSKSTIFGQRWCTSKLFPSALYPAGQNIKFTEKERKMLLKWVELCKFEGLSMPTNISEEQLIELFKTKTQTMRKKYLNYLFRKEIMRENKQIKKVEKSEIVQHRREKKVSYQTDHIKYGLWENALFIKSNKRHLMDIYYHRLITAMKFGQPLVIDLDFDNHMAGKQMYPFANELHQAISMNRRSCEPFNLTLCNVNFNSKPFKKFTHIMPNVLEPSFPLNMHKESYLDIFPKEKIIYLTPDAREVMKQFDHSAIYIIGGIVDQGKEKPYTLMKAKKEKIKMQRLPLDKHFLFRGSKSLEIHVMIAILEEIQKHGNWSKAFEWVPRRLISAGHRHMDDSGTEDLWTKKQNLF